MADHTRRRYLTAIAGASAAGLAGCSGLLGSGGGGGGASADFRADAEFVPASVAESAGSVELLYVDIPTIRSDFPEDVQSEFGFEAFSTELGIDVGDFGGLLSVETAATSGIQVLTGSFAASDILDEAEIDEGSRQYEGYEVLDGQLAIADEVVVIGTNYQRMIDAKSGTADRLVEESEQWSQAVENAAGGAVCGVERTPGETYSLMATTINAGGDGGMEFTGYAHFDSESDAEANQEAVQDSASDDMNEEQGVTIESVSVDGSVVVVEAVAEDISF